MVTALRPYAARLVAAAIIVGLYAGAQLPALSSPEQAALAARFAFSSAPLPTLPGESLRASRVVHPSLGRIAGWISSVGASIALHDLDGDGLPNDSCHVDPRTNQVIVAPVPGTGDRYLPFALDPTGVPYDTVTMAPMGCLPDDLNEDGQADLLVYYWGRPPIGFLHQAVSGAAGPALSAAGYMTQEIVPGGERWYTNAATFADLDGDGHADLVIGNYFPDGSRILDPTATDAAQMQHSMSRAYNAGRNRLLRWTGATAGAAPSVQFVEADGVLEDEVAHGWTLAVGAADLDGDLLPELYFANDFGPDRLLHNRSIPGQFRFARLEGEKTFTTPNSKVLGRDSFKGMGVDFGDLNGDGRLDMFVSNIAGEYALEESHFAWISTGAPGQMQQGIAPYEDRSEALGLARSGWGWDTRLADFDNDGVLEALQATGFVQGTTNRWPELQELAMSNDELLSNPLLWPRFSGDDDLSGHQPNPFFVRAANGRYYDLAPALGLATPQVSRGLATADVDGDGRLDFAVANQWDTSWFYHNTSGQPGAFLGLHLLLPLQPGSATRARSGHPGADTHGRPAIGAQATVILPDGRRLVAQVDGGNGHSGKRSPDLQFGLAARPAATRLPVELRWRDPAGQVHTETLELAPGWQTIILGW